MSPTSVLESLVGTLLVFFLPGYAVTKAIFPEWRVRGRVASRRLVEIVTLSFVLSVTLTLLVGYLLLAAGPGGFQASWSDPILESVLLGVTVLAFGTGVVRGAYGREPPPGPVPRSGSGEEGAFELTSRLDHLSREGRRLRRALGAPGTSAEEATAIRTRLAEIDRQSAELTSHREAEYAE